MKPDKKTIEQLLEKYLNGETSLSEEETLRTWFEEPDVVEMVPDMGQIFEMYRAVERIEHPSDSPGIESSLKSERGARIFGEGDRSTGHIQMHWAYGIAAGFALMIAGLAVGLLVAGSGSVQNEQIAELRSDVREMKSMVALARLQNESPSERIMAAYEVKQLDRADDEVINALINTMQHDPQVNVRIAAAEALFEFGNIDKVRRAMIETLHGQDAPVLQIKLIDMLVRLKEKRAIPHLQKVMQSDREVQAVRDKAAQGMAILL